MNPSARSSVPHVVFRADAHENLGAGHLMRCLSLAHAMRSHGWSVTFVTCPLIPSYAQRVREAGCQLRIRSAEDDASQTCKIAKDIGADWIVLDGYPFDASYQRSLKKGGDKIVCIDDQGACDGYAADIILNQNISAEAAWYDGKATGSRLLLGVDYVLLGPQFRAWTHKRGASATVERILVTLGGADPLNITLKILRALDMLSQGFAVDVVIGGVSQHCREVEQYASAMKHPANIIIDTKDMPSLMDQADLAIAAAGTTSWELLYMGVPFVTGAFAKNQRMNAEELGKRHLAIHAGWYPDIAEEALSRAIGSLIDDAGARTLLSRQGPTMIDGDGVERVLQAMEQPAIALRKATMEDARLLWEWANDAAVRASSFSTGAISWETHREWLMKKLADDGCWIYVGIDAKGKPIGQIRFDVREDGDADVDVHTAPDARGKGYGTALIAEGLRRYVGETRAPAVHAFVKIGNDASRKAFLGAGFMEEGKETVQGEEVYHLLSRYP